jgi:hypothetical protein
MEPTVNLADRCQWLGENGAAEAGRILDFLGTVGIEVVAGEIGDSLLNSMTVRHGTIIVDPAIRHGPAICCMMPAMSL